MVDKLKLFFSVKWFNIKDQLFVLRKLCKNKYFKYLFLDLLFGMIYFFVNPYREARLFFKKEKESCQLDNTYGETPVNVLNEIIDRINFKPGDSFIDLGGGRGKLSLYLATNFSIKVKYIEWVPIFSKIIVFIKKVFKLKNLEIINKNIFEIDCIEADYIYFYGLCFEKKEIQKIIKILKRSEKNFKIITISYSLSSYDKAFKLLDSFKAVFPWGETECYINNFIC